MNCARARDLLHPHADGELGVAASLDLERHLANCPGCAGEIGRVRDVRAAVATAPCFKASPQLRQRIRAATVGQTRTPRPDRWRLPASLALAACVLLGATLGLVVVRFTTPRGDDALANELVAAHVRSLMADHLLDVPSTDRHTVKPWFAGRLDFSPDVRDLSPGGFPLAGGRLDYLAGRPVAALVYRHDKHVINCFLWPADPAAPDAPPTAQSVRSYSVVHFTHAGLTACAVSDASPATLLKFAEVFRASAPPP